MTPWLQHLNYFLALTASGIAVLWPVNNSLAHHSPVWDIVLVSYLKETPTNLLFILRRTFSVWLNCWRRRLQVPQTYMLRAPHPPSFLWEDQLKERRGLDGCCFRNTEQSEPLRLKYASWPQKAESVLGDNVMGFEMNFWSASTSFVLYWTFISLTSWVKCFFPVAFKCLD